MARQQSSSTVVCCIMLCQNLAAECARTQTRLSGALSICCFCVLSGLCIGAGAVLCLAPGAVDWQPDCYRGAAAHGVPVCGCRCSLRELGDRLGRPVPPDARPPIARYSTCIPCTADLLVSPDQRSHAVHDECDEPLEHSVQNWTVLSTSRGHTVDSLLHGVCCCRAHSCSAAYCNCTATFSRVPVLCTGAFLWMLECRERRHLLAQLRRGLQADAMAPALHGKAARCCRGRRSTF